MYVRPEHALLQFFIAIHKKIQFDVFDFPAENASCFQDGLNLV